MSRNLAFWIVGATLVLFLFAAAAPSPLYGVYAARWHFSAITLTEVFGVYAIALLVTLLLTGSLSDAVGRRPVILASLGIQLAGMALFVLASSVEWLFAARIVQGVATGLTTSALAASLVDLNPPLAPVVNAASPTVGLALGGLTSAALAQYAPDPLHLVYVVLIAGFFAAAVATAVMPEPTRQRGPMHWIPRVDVEPSIRPAFTAGLPMLIAGWGVGGFYLSLGPSVVLQLAASSSRLLGGIAIALLAGVGAISTIAASAWQPPRLMTVGGVSLPVGLAISVAAVLVGSSVLFFVGTAVTGVGFGLGWLGVLRSLVARASPSERGALLATIFIVAYLSFAVPAVIAGVLVTRIGLHDAALWYGTGVGLLALAGLVGALTVGRPERARVGTT
ncbi:MAG TPA: MFS transporter [Candidatus Dormibacteraeota bacterium]|nr:MFS transporter [Candidatus Dormibacteraeota bacterium]